MRMSRKQIEAKLRLHWKFLAPTTPQERRSYGMRWRVNRLTNDGIHGYDGGDYFPTLADVQAWLETEEQNARSDQSVDAGSDSDP